MQSSKFVFLPIWVAQLLTLTSAFLQWHTAGDNRKYLIDSEMKYTWLQAVDECSRRNLKLAEPDNQSKNYNLNRLLNEKIGKNECLWIWIGFHDEFSMTGGRNRLFYTLSTGQVMRFNQWYRGEPKNNKFSEHCVQLHRYPSGYIYWNDNDCDIKMGLVCEERPQLAIATATKSPNCQTCQRPCPAPTKGYCATILENQLANCNRKVAQTQNQMQRCDVNWQNCRLDSNRAFFTHQRQMRESEDRAKRNLESWKLYERRECSRKLTNAGSKCKADMGHSVKKCNSDIQRLKTNYELQLQKKCATTVHATTCKPNLEALTKCKTDLQNLQAKCKADKKVTCPITYQNNCDSEMKDLTTCKSDLLELKTECETKKPCVSAQQLQCESNLKHLAAECKSNLSHLKSKFYSDSKRTKFICKAALRRLSNKCRSQAMHSECIQEVDKEDCRSSLKLLMSNCKTDLQSLHTQYSSDLKNITTKCDKGSQVDCTTLSLTESIISSSSCNNPTGPVQPTVIPIPDKPIIDFVQIPPNNSSSEFSNSSNTANVAEIHISNATIQTTEEIAKIWQEFVTVLQENPMINHQNVNETKCDEGSILKIWQQTVEEINKNPMITNKQEWIAKVTMNIHQLLQHVYSNKNRGPEVSIALITVRFG